jgi:pilus assembly protein CpaE
MPEKSNTIPALAIVDPGATQQQIEAALGSQNEFRLVSVLNSVENLPKEILNADPEIILIDHQVAEQSTLDTIDELALRFPQVPMVAILPTGDSLPAQQAMLAGVRAFVVQPFTQVNLLSTLRRVRDLEARRRHSQEAAVVESVERTEPLRILTVFSPRGGVGCSTVAVNLAVALHETLDERVLLMDGKLLFGHLGLILNIRSSNTIADLIPHASTLDSSLIKEVVAEHASGIHVLLSPTDVQVAQGVRPDDLYNVLRGISRLYDFIVIDAGSHVNENTVTLMDAADRLLLITTPDLAALHDTSRFFQLSRSLAYPPGKLLVILNRAGMPGAVKIKDIETALRHELFAQIPDDGAIVMHSLNRGVPLLFKYPRSPTTRAIQKLASRLADIGVGEPFTEASRSGSMMGRLRARVTPARVSQAGAK